MSDKKFRIAITGATTPKGKALKEALPRTIFRKADVRLIDEEELEGTLTEYDGGVELIRQMTIDSFTGVDLVFFCDDAEKASAHLQLMREQFGDAAPAVVDLSGSYSLSEQPKRRSHSLPHEGDFTQNQIFLPHPLALGIAHVLDLCRAFGEMDRVFATALVPVSDLGNAGIKALHEQLVEIMNFGDMPKDFFGQQLIFNILPSMGPIDNDGGTEIESGVIQQVRNLLGKKDLPLQLLINQAPVFFAYTVSILISFNAPVETGRIRQAFDKAAGFSISGESLTGPLEATDSNDYRVARLVAVPGDPHSVAMWFTFDNVTTGSVNQAVLLAEELFEGDSRLKKS